MKCVNCPNEDELGIKEKLHGKDGDIQVVYVYRCECCGSEYFDRGNADKFMETKERNFYMNWVVGGKAPKYQFQDLKSAMKEAERLAGKEDESVYVLVPVKVVRVRKEIEWEDC